MREGLHRGEGMAVHQRLVLDPGHQVADVGREMLGPLVGRGIEREGGAAVGARRAAQTHVDAAGRQGVEHAEDFGHLEGRVVRQHDPGAADADALGRGGDRSHHDLRRGADDGRDGCDARDTQKRS